ncbi:hypothetical protein [Methylomonas lenta]|uniref:hypothetical protein n=1 Tax=Methylomonas lenta TaxID=980561 RepID=UPI000ADAA3CC|nr:hypothetical protein [Methylomonas lenta]
MPVASFSISKADDGRMNIKYQGGNEMAVGMVDLIVGYANRIDAPAGIPATFS